MDSYNKRNFWEALVIAIFIFGIGILLGYLLEANRASQISEDFKVSELNMLDIRAQSDLFNLKHIDCDAALNEIIAFANRIYDEAVLLNRYEGASEIGKDITQEHKKYDVLRAILFANTLSIKEKCNNSFNTLLYLYEYQTEDMDKSSLQNIFSKKLMEVRNENGDKVILIPLAGNIGANSISYIMRAYNITTLPTILVNGKTQITSAEQLKEINSMLSK